MTIRRMPEDFVVEELIAPEVRAEWTRARASGVDHAVLELTKTSLTTPDALVQVAKAIGVRPGAVDYAGLKDKHARTVQHLSVKLDGQTASKMEATAAERSGKNWSARLVGWSSRPMAAEAIAANRFTIVVRDLSPAVCGEMDRRAARLATSTGTGPEAEATSGLTRARELLFINYFGDQRFGSARHGRGFIARRLIAGEFEEALRLTIATPARKDAPRVKQLRRLLAENWGRWTEVLARLPKGVERRVVEVLAATGDFRAGFAALPHFQQVMTVEAYQSHLWNATARKLAGEIAGREPRLLRTDDVFGELLFPEAPTISPTWGAISMPMLSPDSVLDGVWAAAARGVLAEEGINVTDLRIPGLRRPAFGSAERPLIARARAFEMTEPEADELSPGRRRLRRTLRFELPRGAYATVALRALGQ